MTIEICKFIIKTHKKWGIGKSPGGNEVFHGENLPSASVLIFERKEGDFMFIGTYEHNMDAKNRVFVPVKFREELGENIYYRLYASEDCPSVQLYSEDEFKKQFESPVAGVTNLAKKRALLAKIYLGTGTAAYDNQGRITIGSVIAEKAGFEKECIFVGFGSYVELMSKAAYETYLKKICESNSADEDAVEKEADVYRQMMGEGRFLDVEVE